jgi:hypothetical protein
VVRAGELEEAVAGRARRADGRGDRRAQEVRVGEQLFLGPLLEPRRDEQRVGRRQAQLPAGGRTAVGDVHDDAHERGNVELEAAVAPRDEHAVEAGGAELLVRVGGVAGARLRLGLALDQRQADRGRAGDQLLGRQLRLRRRDAVGARLGGHCAVNPPSATISAPVT